MIARRYEVSAEARGEVNNEQLTSGRRVLACEQFLIVFNSRLLRHILQDGSFKIDG